MTMPKFASKDADHTLSRLDTFAKTIQEKHASWGMPFEVAKEMVNFLDKTADEIEVASFGPDSLQARQAEVVTKTAKVIQKDSDEKYMDTFNAPMKALQADGDEPYMRQYADDQSAAVQSGKSTSGRPLAP